MTKAEYTFEKYASAIEEFEKEGGAKQVVDAVKRFPGSLGRALKRDFYNTKYDLAHAEKGKKLKALARAIGRMDTKTKGALATAGTAGIGGAAYGVKKLLSKKEK